MSSADAEQTPLASARGAPVAYHPIGEAAGPGGSPRSDMTSAGLLFANGQTTERMVLASERLAEALGFRASVLPSPWREPAQRLERW